MRATKGICLPHHVDAIHDYSKIMNEFLKLFNCITLKIVIICNAILKNKYFGTEYMAELGILVAFFFFSLLFTSFFAFGAFGFFSFLGFFFTSFELFLVGNSATKDSVDELP